MDNKNILQRIGKVIMSGIFTWLRRDFDKSLIKPQALLNNDLGIDSLGAIEFAFALEEEFDVSLTDEDVEKFVTIQDIIRCLDEKLASATAQLAASLYRGLGQNQDINLL